MKIQINGHRNVHDN